MEISTCMQDFYSLLGVNQNSSLKDIKIKFRELAMVYHPDRGGNPDEFKRLKTAYEWLVQNHKQEKNYIFDASSDALFKKLFWNPNPPFRR